jgi:flagellar biosynthesis protein FlhG
MSTSIGNAYRKANSFTRTIAITSGKGGVGKTTLAANLGFLLAKEGHKVLLFDGDLGMANLDIMLGVRPKGHLQEVLDGQKTMAEIVTEVNPNLYLISGGSGVSELGRLNSFQRRLLMESVSSLNLRFDYMLIDSAPGISDNTLFLNAAAQNIMVVLTPDPASFADAYALIKVLNQEYKESRFSIVANQVRDEQEGLLLFHRFQDVVYRFLDVGLDYWGSIPQDLVLRKSNQMQRLILRHDPYAPSAQSLGQISKRISTNVSESNNKAGLQFFWEQILGVA